MTDLPPFPNCRSTARSTTPSIFHTGKETKRPPQLKADTSTEIALNLVAAANRDELTRGIELVTNNHFDTDGLLSVWTVLTGERALELRDQLIAAAEAGDFSEFTNENGGAREHRDPGLRSTGSRAKKRHRRWPANSPVKTSPTTRALTS